jgi:hypothetical protein
LTLTLEQKVNLISLSIKQGFHREIRQDWILSFLKGSIGYGSGQSHHASISPLKINLFEPYRFLSFSTQGGQTYLDNILKQSTYARSMLNHFNVLNLASLDSMIFLQAQSVLITKYGTAAFKEIQNFFDDQHASQYVAIQLEKGHVDPFFTVARHQQDVYMLSTVAPYDDDKSFRMTKNLSQAFPTAVITPIDEWYPSTCIVMIENKDYRAFKEKLSEYIYRKDIQEIELVNRSIFTYIL